MVVVALVASLLSPLTGVAGAATAPTTPTALNAVARNGAVSLSWMEPASNGGAAITGYRVTPFVGYFPLPTRTFASAATAQQITGLTNGTTYRFKVSAVNSVGASADSVQSNAVTPTSSTAPAPTTFVHPGVLMTKADLDFVRAQVAAKRQPWKAAYDAVLGGYSSESTSLRPTRYRFSSLSYVPAPVSVVQWGASESYIAAHPELGLKNIGGTEHTDDAQAAYTQALLWAYTGNSSYANKAIQIMNAWSAKLTEIKFASPVRLDNGEPVYLNGKLQAGWGGSLFARAAEIIRYTGAGWASADITRFSNMLTNVYLPLTMDGWPNTPNWMLTLAEATISIGVFTNNRAAFDAGVAEWRDKAPTTIYMASDGMLPLAPADYYDTSSEMKTYWYYPTTYVSGLQGETLRDISHMAFGLGAMANAAQTARIQGVDLFAEQQARIVAGFERNAGWVNQYLDKVAALGGAAPPSTWKPVGWPGTTFKVGGLGYRGGWEVAYAYLSSIKVDMPATKRLVTRLRPTQPLFHTTWETLTHAKA